MTQEQVENRQRVPDHVYIKTPLLHSAPLSKIASQCGRKVEVYLKMEALQPSGSFKVRGLGNAILREKQRRGSSTTDFHIISSSGGNAGLAAAYCARQMQEPCTIFVPSTCEPFVQELLKAEGANVIVAGPAWDECDVAAKKLLEEENSAGKTAYYVHPFEGENTIDGHSTMVDEIVDQLKEIGCKEGKPDIITCSAGGSGLIRGVMRGVRRAFIQGGNEKLPQIVVTQTFGANSFGSSIEEARKRGQKWDDKDLVPISLPAITSKATSLGAKTCSTLSFRDGVRYGDQLSTLMIEDRMAEDAAWRFAQDHRLLVELACSCVLAPIYNPSRIMNEIVAGQKSIDGPIILVVIVCGGNKINSEMIEQYRLESVRNGVIEMEKSKVTLNGRFI